jgi:uncharacterized membrane protein SpoIIM required for sporulation
MSALRLKSYEFRREREKGWRRLEQLVDKAERTGIRGLTGEEVLQLPQLYRSALSSLNVARAISLDKNVVDYLEGLTQRAYFAAYGVRRHLRETVADFFVHTFPATVRRFGWHMALAGITLIAAALAGFLLVSADPDRFHAFVDPGMAQGRNPEASTEELREVLYSTDHETSGLGYFASMLFTHNAKVGMLCFALGFIAGIPVFLLLFTNGLLLGAFLALYASRGLGWELAAWLAPHGVTELLAVVLCGGAGLVLAQSLVFPGRLPRLKNLAVRGRQAGIVVLGTVLMFLVAGLIEGFFRQMVHDVGVRTTVALVSAVFWIAYLGAAGRGRRRR